MRSVSEASRLDRSVAVRVENLSIQYRAVVDKGASLKSALLHLGRARKAHRQVRVIEALKGVSLEIPHGSVLGLVGANGAGKSTMMRAMAGILAPSEGRITVQGRVSTLLALGVGFNGALTGRENVYLGGLAAGLPVDEIEHRFEEIAAFADLPDGFIDMPMRTYSSGMYGRLGFAVSIHMDPDILLIDEALSTGDAAFKEKSFAKMRELVEKARTIVIVSHALQTITELCTEAAWLHKGQLVQHGSPAEITTAYRNFLQVGETAVTMEDV